MIRIAFFAEILISDFDGAARTIFQLIDRIDPNQFEFLFIYGKGPKQFRHYPSLRVPTLKLPINDDYSLAMPRLIKQELKETLNNFNPDIIHISTPSPLGFYALKYANKRSIPITTIYHTHFISYIPYYFRNISMLIKPVEKWIMNTMQSFYNNCSNIYTPTRSIINELATMNIDSKKLLLWQRGIDLNIFNPSKRQHGYFHKITNNNKPNILFVSRLVWEKNIETLIDIYKRLENDGMPYNLIIVGDGTAKRTAMLEMPKAHFLGKKDHEELSTIYASADVFIFTSISETYGNVVTEAMASGLPCVIANGGGSADLIEHRVTGFKCEPTNSSMYLHYVKKLIENPEIKNNICDNNALLVKNMDWDILVKRYCEDINRLVDERRTEWSWVAS